MGGGISGGMGGRSTPKFPTYNPSPKPESYNSYEAEKKKAFSAVPKGKGMQLGRKSKTTDMFEKVRGDLGPEADERAPLVSAPVQESVASPARSSFADGNPISVTIAEQISAELAHDGNMKSFEVKGNLMLRITDPSLTKLKLDIRADASSGAQFRTHPSVDKPAFTNQQVLQLKDTSKGFPVNNQAALLRWHQASGEAPISFTIWVNQGPRNGRYSVTVEYELANEEDLLRDVVVSIPFKRDEPSVNSMDEVYEVAGDSLDWTIPSVGEENATGAFEFEIEAEDESEFFPMRVGFRMERPIVGVEVNDITLIEMGESVDFAKEVRSVAENYLIV